jgi:hypothetical protein
MGEGNERQGGRVRKMTKYTIAACVAALGIVALAPGSASAARSATQATIKISGNGFRGKVTSPRKSCVTHREVKLQRRKSSSSFFRNIGTDRASSDGSWSVRTKPIDRAEYRAVIKAKAGANGCFPFTTEATKAHRAGLSILKQSSDFHGQVATGVANCQPGRKVVLQRKSPSSSGFDTIGFDLSDKRGNWLVNKAPSSGSSYRAVARAKQVNSTTSCIRRASPTIPG